MAKVLSVINLKGGVGKTTLTVAVAEALAAEGARVLVMDLDPQTNATAMIIGDEKWRELDGKGLTLPHLFQSALDGKAVRLEDVLVREAEKVRGYGGAGECPVDLVPSGIGLITLQDRLAAIPSGEFHSRAPTAVIRGAAGRVLDDYDFVLADCPPNLGVITLNGLLISDGFIIPTIPDILSTYGIPQIIGRVREFSRETGKATRALGIVASKYREQSPVHREILRGLRDERDAPFFETVVKEGAHQGEAAGFRAEARTLSERWKAGAASWTALAREIREKLEALE